MTSTNLIRTRLMRLSITSRSLNRNPQTKGISLALLASVMRTRRYPLILWICSPWFSIINPNLRSQSLYKPSRVNPNILSIHPNSVGVPLTIGLNKIMKQLFFKMMKRVFWNHFSRYLIWSAKSNILKS